MKIPNVPILSLLAMAGLAYVQGQGSLIWLGPGRYTDGKSEVFTLPSEGSSALGNSSCSIPAHPLTDIGSSVGFINNGFLTLCGGSSYSSSPPNQDTCYSLKNSVWSITSTMKVARDGAAAIILTNGSAVVAGGYNGTNNYFKSTELLSEDGVWHIGEDLPIPMYAQCMLQLSTGEIFLNGGYGGNRKETYLATTYGSSWEKRAEMKNERWHHTCTEMTNPIQQIWVGGGTYYEDTTEIYTPGSDSWEDGPSLPIKASVSGRFINYLSTIIHCEGSDTTDVHMLNSARDGWIRIGEMTQPRYFYPALVISEEVCYGEKVTPFELSYTADGSTGYVSGSLVPIVTNFASNSSETIVSCCSNGIISNVTCGNGTSCDNICGDQDTSTGCVTIVTDEFPAAEAGHQICSDSMQGGGWCTKASVIKELTNDCAAERMALTKVYDLVKPTNQTCTAARKKRAPQICLACITTIFNIWYCKGKVLHVDHLDSRPICCLHPITRRVPGVVRKCCVDYGLCV